MMSRKELDLWVGLFVAIGIGAVLFLALKVANQSSIATSDAYQVEAPFDNIGGLKVRAPVKSAGVVVGRVEGIVLDQQKFMANVKIRIDNHYKFPKDTTAAILTSGLLGEQYIGLEAGGDTANLAQDDRIKLTQSAVVLEKLIGQFLYGKAAEGNAK